MAESISNYFAEDSLKQVGEQYSKDIKLELDNVAEVARIFLGILQSEIKNVDYRLFTGKKLKNYGFKKGSEEEGRWEREAYKAVLANRLYKEAKADKDKNEEKIISKVMAFQEKINEFLNISIVLTYVDEKGNIYFVDSDTELDLLKNKSFSQKRAKYNIPSTTMLKKIKPETGLNELIKEEEKEIEEKKIFREHYKNVQNLYNTIIKNEFIAQEESEKTTPSIYSPSNYRSHFLVIKNQEKYIFNIFQNYGVLKEGYVSAVMDYHKENVRKIFEQNDDDGKADFLYCNYISRVDNAPGAIQGDIETNLKQENRTLELAVKSGSFGSQSFSILVDLALFIIEIEKEGSIKKEDFKKTFVENFLKRTSSYLTKYLDDKAKRELEQNLSKDLGSLGSISFRGSEIHRQS